MFKTKIQASTMLQLSLGDRHKEFEKTSERVIQKDENIIIRLDGKNFSKFTKDFEKPFDDMISKSMISATKALFKEFQDISVGYTQSDEITIIIPAKHNTKSEHQYKGRVSKLISLASATVSMDFAFALTELVLISDIENKEEILKRIRSVKFDARIYSVKDEHECVNSIIWRCRDAEKNSRSMVCYAHLPHKSVIGLNGKERVSLLKEETGIDWETDFHSMYKYGTTIKKVKYVKDCGTVRTKLQEFYIKWFYSEDMEDFALSTHIKRK